MTAPLPASIEEAAVSPASVTTAEGSATAHSLPDQIAVDVHRRRIGASRNPFGCLRRAIAAFAPAAGPNIQNEPPTDYERPL